MNRALNTALLGLTVFATNALADEEVSADDYAWHFPLHLETSADVHLLTLTPEVYRSVFDASLGDLRLITRDGREVGFGPLTAPPLERWRETPWAMQKLSVIYEPISSAVIDETPAYEVEIEEHPFGLRLRHGEYAARATLKLRSNARDAAPIRAIRIDWSAGFDLPEGTRWWIEASDDDRNVLLPERAITRFDHSRSRGQTRISFETLDRTDWRELRLRVQPIPSSLSFDAVFAEYDPDPELYRHSTAVDAVTFTDQTEHGHGFMLSGPYPVHAAKLELDNIDSLASIELLARDTHAPWWQLMGATTAFDVQVDRAQFQRGLISLEPTRHRQWLVRSTPKLSAAPKLSVYYRPDQFLIAHRGPDNLILLAGHRTAKRQSYPVEPLINDLRNRLGAHWQPDAARIGVRVEVLGQAALKPPTPEPPYRQWALWSALILGAAAIAWMAVSLLKETGKTP